jgi:hypothetical protein
MEKQSKFKFIKDFNPTPFTLIHVNAPTHSGVVNSYLNMSGDLCNAFTGNIFASKDSKTLNECTWKYMDAEEIETFKKTRSSFGGRCFFRYIGDRATADLNYNHRHYDIKGIIEFWKLEIDPEEKQSNQGEWFSPEKCEPYRVYSARDKGKNMWPWSFVYKTNSGDVYSIMDGLIKTDIVECIEMNGHDRKVFIEFYKEAKPSFGFAEFGQWPEPGKPVRAVYNNTNNVFNYSDGFLNEEQKINLKYWEYSDQEFKSFERHMQPKAEFHNNRIVNSEREIVAGSDNVSVINPGERIGAHDIEEPVQLFPEESAGINVSELKPGKYFYFNQQNDKIEFEIDEQKNMIVTSKKVPGVIRWASRIFGGKIADLETDPVSGMQIAPDPDDKNTWREITDRHIKYVGESDFIEIDPEVLQMLVDDYDKYLKVNKEVAAGVLETLRNYIS